MVNAIASTPQRKLGRERRRRGNLAAATALILSTASLAACGDKTTTTASTEAMNNTEVSNSSNQPAGVNEVAEGTDIEGLRAIMNVPGEPVRVWYGPYAPSAASRIPGPTDVFYAAVIEYSSPEEVAGLVGEPSGEDPFMWVPGWFPPELQENASMNDAAMLNLPADVFQGGAFASEWVSVPLSAPQFAVVQYDGS